MPHTRRKPSGNFRQDLSRLLDELDRPPILELGKPLPDDKHVPRRQLSRCPAAHNRLLLDEGAEP